LSDSQHDDRDLAAQVLFPPVGPRQDVSTLAQNVPSEPGRKPVVPDYEMLRLIGKGAYGEVWLSRSILGEFRAVKVVWRRNLGEDRPFEREFEGIRRFEPVSRSHPSQLAILHVGKNEELGYFYYVMELADDASAENKVTNRKFKENKPPAVTRLPPIVPDSYRPKTLRQVLRDQGALPAEQCLEISLALSGALAHLHEHGLVHRDIKPSNVIFVRGVPKLADIGLVAAVDDACSFVGTPGYIPPEGPGAPPADVYSLGKVLYEMLSGRDRQEFPALPQDFTLESGDSGSSIVPNEVRDGALQRNLSAELNQVVLAACESDSRLRYRSAQAMHEELALLNTGGSVKRKRTIERLWATGKKIAIAGILLLVAVTLSILMVRQFTHSVSPGDGPPSKNLDADNLSAEGLLIVRGDIYDEFGKAYTNFQKAIELDPGFARPYVGLLELQLHEWLPEIKSMNQEELGTIVNKLEKLGPNLATTHYARAFLSYRALDYPQSRKSIQKAIEMDPKYERAQTDYGYMLLTWGWPIEARDHLKLSLTLAPSKVTTYCVMGHTYRAERDYTNAIAWYRKTLDYRPHHAWAYGALKETYEALGDYENSIDNAEKESVEHGDNPAEARRSYDSLRRALHEGGARGYYQRMWEWAKNDPNEESYWKACLQMRLGNTDAALDWLNKSVQARLRDGSTEGNLKFLIVHECWDPVRNDPRFKELLDKTTFSEVMPRRK
jgi:serine/threonine protein kinase